jgi:hypothetical protein
MVRHTTSQDKLVLLGPEAQRSQKHPAQAFHPGGSISLISARVGGAEQQGALRLSRVYYRESGMSRKIASHGSSAWRTNLRPFTLEWRASYVYVMLLVTTCAFGAWLDSASAANCANEQLRLESHSTQLPDCRAYELVSPPYKDGYFPIVRTASPDGERVLLESIGKFGGAEGNSAAVGTIYEAHRTPLGWATKSVFPPASRFPFALFEDTSLDLKRTLWTAHTTSQSSDAQDLYVREPDGSFVRVGPELPPSAEGAPPGPFGSEHSGNFRYRGATADLSHIFFLAEPEENPTEVPLWSGDKTIAGPSLYEYDGVGNEEPTLIGISNTKHIVSNSEATMITQCGVELGGGERAQGSTYNAISSPSAEKVFFTANVGGCENEMEVGTGPAVNEVYARVNEAETIDLSEPTTGATGNCEECNDSSPEEGLFEGASRDGAKAFFLSGQEGLLPGAEGMNLYEYNFEGPAHKKLVRVSGEITQPKVQGVARISEDGSHVYFVAQGVLAANKNLNNEEATEGNDNLYVFNSITGATSFIGILSGGDEEDWNRRDERPVQATPDGEFLVFASRAHLTPDDRSGPSVPQLFEYDADAGVMVRVSAGQKGQFFCSATEKFESGFNCDGNIDNNALAPVTASLSLPLVEADGAPQPNENLRMSADGTTVIFPSPDPLAPQAINSLSSKLCTNVYEYRWSREGGGMEAGNVFLVSAGNDVAVYKGNCGTEADGMDSSGTDILVASTIQLASQDTNTQRDIYDAREDGGFPGVIKQPGCVADACQGALGLAPQLLGVGSVSQASGNNLPPPGPSVVIKNKNHLLTRAQRLSKALAQCKKTPKRRRAACISRAKKRYGAKGQSSVRRRHGSVHERRAK